MPWAISSRDKAWATKWRRWSRYRPGACGVGSEGYSQHSPSDTWPKRPCIGPTAPHCRRSRWRTRGRRPYDTCIWLEELLRRDTWELQQVKHLCIAKFFASASMDTCWLTAPPPRLFVPLKCTAARMCLFVKMRKFTKIVTVTTGWKQIKHLNTEWLMKFLPENKSVNRIKWNNTGFLSFILKNQIDELWRKKN